MGPMNIKNAKYRSQKQMGLAIVVLSLVFLGGEREREREIERERNYQLLGVEGMRVSYG